ncbi:hypothetical protein AB0L99_24960 [Streptomyces sp. NPDC051954]|uniref:hypothetical protein n=1 Tax=Streptomyces sp. NPDC051954 TaxID=3155524 RepID=UPI0034301B31
MNDDELLALLRDADPALTSRAPLPDINLLVEAALRADTVSLSDNTVTDTTTRTAKAAAGRERRRLFGLAAAAALLVGGGITAGITVNSGNGHSTTADAPLSLTLAGDGIRKCAAPVPDQFAGYPTLFYGTATSVKGPLVTFHVDHWLRGGGTDTVLVNSDPALPESLTFTVGQHYIVAADKNDTIPACGANGASKETWQDFRLAFGK